MKRLIFLILTLILIIGCDNNGEQITSQTIKEVICYSPYIKHETGCCLDKNSNKICDNDEKTNTEILVKSSIEVIEVIEKILQEKAETIPEPKKVIIKKETSSNCIANIFNCADFNTHSEAQAIFRECGGVNNDVHRLDRDKDGLACESLP